MVLGAVFCLVQLRILAPEHDNAFLLDISGWMLDGGRYFYEFQEVNPPLFPVLLFPVHWARALTGFGVYPLFIVWISILITASSVAVLRQLREVLDEGPSGCLWAAVGTEAALFFLPGLDFGQRDHLGVVLFLPALVGLAARDVAASATSRDWLIGVVGVLGLLMKPHLLIVGCSVYAMRLAQERNWRILIEPPLLAGVTVVCLYAGAILIFFPEWLSVMKMARLVYASYDADSWFTNRTFFSLVVIFGLAATNEIFGRGKERRLGRLLAAAAAGALGSYVLQHKDFEYHFIPTKVLVWLLAGLVAMSAVQTVATMSWMPRLLGWTQAARRHRALILCLISLLPLYRMADKTEVFGHQADLDELRLVEFLRVNAAGPRIASFSTSLWPAYPLPMYRASLPAWRFAQPWPISWIVLQEQKGLANAADTVRMSFDLREMVKEDFRRFKPDALLVDESPHMQAIAGKFEMLAWFRRDPELAVLLDDFERVAEFKPPGHEYLPTDLALYRRRARKQP